MLSWALIIHVAAKPLCGFSQIPELFCPPGLQVPQAALRGRAQSASKPDTTFNAGKEGVGRAELQLVFNLENVRCNKHTQTRFFQGV